MSDPLAIFESCSSFLFSEPQLAFGEPGNLCQFEFAQLHIQVKCPLPANSHINLMSHYVWNAALVLCDLLLDESISVNGSVLELGAGAGLPSILAGIKGSHTKIVASDYPDENILETLSFNLGKYLPPQSFSVIGHAWGQSRAHLSQSAPFNHILMADTLWMRSSHSVLLEDLLHLLAPQGKVHVCAGLHTGPAVIQEFVDAAVERGFKVQWLGMAHILEDGSRSIFWGEKLETVGMQGDLDDPGFRKKFVVIFQLESKK